MSSFAPVKYLLVDDLEENLLALSALLQNDGVELLKARSGTQALELLLIHDVALAFLDVRMPVMDGFELAEIMRGNQRTSHVPLIFVTAGAQDQVQLFKGYDLGAVDFLYKPIEPHILKSKANVFFQLYRQKQRLAQELHECSETLRLNEMFTAMLGHDLRSPLSTIMMSAHLLQGRAETDLARKAAERMIASGKWMSRMIEDMLDTARARLGGGIQLTINPLDFSALLDSVIQEKRTADPLARIRLTLQGDFAGRGDADRLAQVMSNLIGNAIQHGDPSGAIEVELDATGKDRVVLQVSNRGTIPAGLIPHLFDPFRGSKPRSSSRGKGLGLGLYIADEIVRAHGGRIEGASKDGLTRFCIDIPRHATY